MNEGQSERRRKQSRRRISTKNILKNKDRIIIGRGGKEN